MSSSLLTLLRSSTTLAHAQQIHAQIIVRCRPLKNHLLAKLADLCSPPDYALSVFRRIPSPNDHSYTTIIRSLAATASSSAEALILYSRMLRDCVGPTNFTFPFVLKSCSALSAPRLGRQVHAHVLRFGADHDLFVGNSLIDMYCKCSMLEDARRVLDDMPNTDGVSYNSLISGYARCGDMTRASELFEAMPATRTVVGWTALIDGFGRAGMVGEMMGLFRQMLVSADDVQPNSTTMVCLLSACAGASNWEIGRWVSTFLDVNVMIPDDVLSTALIAMFSRCGELGKARRVFERIRRKNSVPWNAMLTGYVHGGLPEEAIQLFHRMGSTFVVPNEITMVNLLSACASLGALELGREVHQYLTRKRLQLNNILVTALVDMYSKCGSIDDACLAFVKSHDKDVILWNAMILGLAVHGQGRDALAVFADMERVRVRPDDATFIGVLSACSHSGLTKEGKLSFEKMLDYGLSPKPEHYACLVDLLGRAGHLDEAFSLVRSMVIQPDSVIWGSLLNACRIHHNVELADEVGRFISSSEYPGLGSCILLSNIYASVNRWDDVARVRRMVKEKGMRKPSGCSWIEVDGSVHRFVVEDTAHVQSQEVYMMLRRLTHQLSYDGYEPNFDFDLENIDERDHHSISTSPVSASAQDRPRIESFDTIVSVALIAMFSRCGERLKVFPARTWFHGMPCSRVTSMVGSRRRQSRCSIA